jgi:hypothetical protein
MLCVLGGRRSAVHSPIVLVGSNVSDLRPNDCGSWAYIGDTRGELRGFIYNALAMLDPSIHQPIFDSR